MIEPGADDGVRDTPRRERKQQEPRPPDETRQSAAQHREDQALDQRQSDDAPPACAERKPHRSLARPIERPSQQQIREIRARDQQHESAGTPHGSIEHGRIRADEELAKRGDVQGQLPVGLRVIELLTFANRLHFGPCGVQAHAVRQTPDGEPRIAMTAIAHLRRQDQRHPEVHLLREGEPRRHHAHDLRGGAVHAHTAADHRRIPVEPPHPEAVVQDRDRGSADGLIVGAEIAAEQRPHAHQRKRVGAHFRAFVALGIAVAVGERRGDAVRQRHVLERCGLLAPVAKVGVRGTAALRRGQIQQPVVVAYEREALEQHRVHDAEHTGVDADAHGQRDDGRQRETGTAQQPMKRVTKVLEQTLHAPPKPSRPCVTEVCRNPAPSRSGRPAVRLPRARAACSR